MTVEGANDDISAPGQCVAALNLLTGLPDDKKAQHLEPGAGHYGIFAGKSWRLNIRPLVLNFIDKAAGKPKAKIVARVRPVEASAACPARKVCSALVTASGCSSCGRWPASCNDLKSSPAASSRPVNSGPAAAERWCRPHRQGSASAHCLAQGLLLVRAALHRAKLALNWSVPSVAAMSWTRARISSRQGASMQGGRREASGRCSRPGDRSWRRPDQRLLRGRKLLAVPAGDRSRSTRSG